MVDLAPDLSVSDGHLVFEGVDLVELAGRVGTPFFVFSPRAHRAEREEPACGPSRAATLDTEIFFASKACSNLWFLDQVRRAGINVEVNSGRRARKAGRAGFAPEQIIFNGVAKTRDEIRAASAPGVRGLTVDSLFELERIADVAAALGLHGAGRPAGRRATCRRSPTPVS